MWRTAKHRHGSTRLTGTWGRSSTCTTPPWKCWPSRSTRTTRSHTHIRRVQRHTLAAAKALGITDPLDLKAIEAGALLHDIGKLAVPDYALNKPGALSRSKYDTMKKHASLGARVLT